MRATQRILLVSSYHLIQNQHTYITIKRWVPDLKKETFTQLNTYGHWLAKECNSEPWRGVLAILTHASDPPQNFETRQYGFPLTAVCRWRQIWQWAVKVSAPEDETKPVELWRHLAREFSIFLGKENIERRRACLQRH